MPDGDRSGPLGMGPGSGRGAGFCAGHGMPGYANPRPGRVMGRGRGGGRGGGRWIEGRGGDWGAGWRARFGRWGFGEADSTGETGDTLRGELEEMRSRLEELEKRSGARDEKE